MSKIRVAMVGLGFGAEFIPIYQRHPNAEVYAVCRRNRKELDACGDRFAVKIRYTSYDDLLKDPNVDAVHINSPIADHAPQAIAALKAGKHVASTVPAATTTDECRQIVEWQRKSGKVYMMMETVVYSREYLFVKGLFDAGELGRIQFMAGLLGGIPAHALRHPLRQPVSRPDRPACRARGLPRLRPHRRTPDPQVRQSVRD
jgi:predicted dehydrogenase